MAALRVPLQAGTVRQTRRTIRHYRGSIEATIEWRLTNGIAESNNAASIGRLRTNARGFHTAEAFITMIMLDRAGIGPQLHVRAFGFTHPLHFAGGLGGWFGECYVVVVGL